MDLLDELESMARVAATQPEDTEPNSDHVKRWQSLFGYTYFGAAQKIQEHRSDLAPWQVSQHHWEMVRADNEAQGHDKESRQGPLRAASVHPTLGSDATPPHNRLGSESDQRLLPAQDQCPVWYIFHGTLADPAVLKSRLGVEPVCRPAKTRGGVLATWGGKYRALVDAPAYGTGVVGGHAFLVADKDQEDSLRFYETDNYGAVRCVIDMGEGEEVGGLTFRFIGEADALRES
ncbi:hypothetical protein CSHISOI_08663 [Colletotrichum shisoi]|uniref:Gamma-glutamylcyclotransferase AIG2-like domain-containing protein n=1 Tax=Colletotrichum shisoi TaxID=2078593 RepID=A0A5Q4BIK2_9PEZI|nr:hypothetical protein CSHISOI_08663 [Colletotrichum shisoi]